MTSKPRILAVDDSATNRMLIARLLETYGWSVALAATGAEAVQALSGPDDHAFDAVLMDIEMPDMRGEEATRLVRAHEASRSDTRRVPIIALTANNTPDQVARYLASGMDAHASKPIDWPKLIATIETFVRRRN